MVAAGIGLAFMTIFLIAYLALALYYRDGSYSFGTYINGTYCTGMTVEEVNSLLSANYAEKKIVVLLEDGSSQELCLTKDCISVDFTAELNRIMETQNPFLWIRNITAFGHYRIEPQISYDQTRLDEAISALPCVAQEQPELQLYIGIGENGFELYDNTQSFYSPESAKQYIYDAVMAGKTTVNLSDSGCYDMALAVTNEMEKVYRQWEAVEAFQEFRMNYLFGDDVETVDAAVTSNFLIRNADGSFRTDETGALAINEEAVAAYIDSLAEKYDTYGIPRRYTTVTGETVSVENSIYGNQLDTEAETAYLLEAIRTRNTSDRTPEYLQMALYQGLNDVGPNYIEVNLTDQKLYFVLNGELYLETDIVSGNLSWNLGTPSVICYVQGRYRNKVLRGPGYASFVNYWVPVYKNIGLHDATWRNSFGGEIYRTNGSHGCINIPLEVMRVVYDQLENGMPVIMYREDEPEAVENA